MIAAGIDLGGTKIEAQTFAEDWSLLEAKRVETPKDYEALTQAMKELIDWAGEGNQDIPIGLGSAGLVNPDTGLATTANLPATGRPLIRTIEAEVGRKVTFINDCRALTLSEARFGVAKDKSPVVGLVLGTGVGGGMVIDGRLQAGVRGLSGEFGHLAIPTQVIEDLVLPSLICGCGRKACFETLMSGPGLSRLAKSQIGKSLSPEEIVARKADDQELAEVWQIWVQLVAELLLTITFTIDPEMIVLGGGLSKASGLPEDLEEALALRQFHGYSIPEIKIAEGGDASGARGAAYFAWLEHNHG